MARGHHFRADGGKMTSYTNTPNNVEEEAEGKRRKNGGKAMKHVGMEGAMTKHRRLDRPGRKRGGGVGADMTPLTSAARVTQASAHKADDDELAE